MRLILGAVTWLAQAWLAWMQSRRIRRLGFAEPKIRRMDFSEQQFHIEIEPPVPEVISILAVESAKLLTEHDADNYVQLDVVPQCQILDPIRLTVAWAIGEMPATKAERLSRRIAKLESALDGDPSQTATSEQRRRWRLSAVRYADKLEARLAKFESAAQLAITLIDFHQLAGSGVGEDEWQGLLDLLNGAMKEV